MTERSVPTSAAQLLWAAVLSATCLMVHPAYSADPNLDWRTLESEHFRFHYHQGGLGFATRAAAISEEAYDTLTQAFGWREWDEPIHVVCTDQVDGANGVASNIPYNTITLLAFAPEADTDLARYDDWLRLLVYHELLHILHIDQMELGARWVNHVLGKTLAPNNALPTWFIEGFATWVETQYTGGGRVGSAAYEQYLRVAALEGTLPDSLDGLGGGRIEPPGGSWPYVFGSDFIRFIVARHGEDDLVEFVNRYGRRIIPYGLNNVARMSFGEDFPTMFKAWHRERVSGSNVLAASLRKAGLRTGRRLTTGGLTHHVPVFAPDGRLSYSHTDGWTPTRRYLARVTEHGLEDAESLYECFGGCGRAGFDRSGENLYSTSGRWPDPHVFFRDIVSFDLRTPQKVGANHLPERLTRRLRARELDLRPDEKALVFATARWGRTALVELDLKTGKERTLVPFEEEWQFNQPRYLERTSDGWRILVSAQKDGGWRELFVLEPDGRMTRLTSNPHREISPVLSPDRRSVYFSSDRTGIWNIHRIDLETAEEFQVTRVIGAAHLPAISWDGRSLAYIGYHATGRDLYLVDIESTREERLPLDRRPVPPRYQPVPVEVVDRDYQPWRASWPRSVELELTTDALQGTGTVSMSVFGNDAVGNHFWSTVLNYFVGEQDVNVAASYTYSGWWPSVSFFVSRWSGEGARFVADDFSTFHMENIYGSISTNIQLPDILDSFSLGAEVNMWGFFDPSPPLRAPLNDPGSNVPFTTEDGYRLGLRLRWSYGRVDSWPFSISPERGVRAGMSFTIYPEWLGNDDDSWTLSWYLDAYVPMYFAKGHVFALKYSGARAGGDEGARGSFSLGGFPEQDLVFDLINEGGIFGNYLRGYAPGQFSGDIYHLFTFEYRLPVADIFWGPGTLPIWLERLSARVFSDLGILWFERFDPVDSVKASVGGELMLTTELFYNFPVIFRMGYAHAVTQPASQQFYIILGSNL